MADLDHTHPVPDCDDELQWMVGKTYIWEPLSELARSEVVVTSVDWNGGEYWVTSEGEDGKACRNNLSRFLEAISHDPCPVEIENEQLRLRLAEYGGQRCTAACPPFSGCAKSHWCLRPQGHDGSHIWECQRTPLPEQLRDATVETPVPNNLSAGS